MEGVEGKNEKKVNVSCSNDQNLKTSQRHDDKTGTVQQKYYILYC